MNLIWFFIPVYFACIIPLFIHPTKPDHIIMLCLSILFALFSLGMVLKAFNERTNVFLAWGQIIMNHFWIVLSISYNDEVPLSQLFIYLSGVIIGGLIGFICLKKISHTEEITLDRFQGHSYEHPVSALIFLLSCLCLSGFPITPTFIGLDLMFSHIHHHQIIFASCLSISFIVTGLALIRLYSRVFMGPHLKTYHEIPFKSS